MSNLCGVGDQGQRYEHRCDNEDGKQIVFGWSSSPNSFKKMIELNPAYSNHVVIDRRKEDENI